MKTRALVCLGAALAAQGLFAAFPTASNLVVHPRWPFSTTVDIEFLLSSGDECDLDIYATWDGQAEPKRLCTSCQSRPGFHHVAWDPAGVGLDAQELKNFTVTVTPVSPEDRLFLTIDLIHTNYSFSATAPANSLEERYGHMSFRRVRARRADGSTIIYTNGYETAVLNIKLPSGATSYTTLKDRNRTGLREVWFSSDYFIALYPLTAGQATRLGAKDNNPPNYPTGINMYEMRYPNVRGWTNETEGVNWPKTGFTVAPNRAAGLARAFVRKFLPDTFLDVPTKAQWETAARSGEKGDHIFSLSQSVLDKGFNPISPTNCDTGMMTNLLDQIAIWKHNRTTAGDNRNVGRLAPNAWGLYDTAGLFYEMTISVSNWGSAGDNAGLDPISSKTTIQYMAATKGNYALLGGQDQKTCEVYQAVPGEGFGGDYRDTAAGVRFVINTTDWMADRTW